MIHQEVAPRRSCQNENPKSQQRREDNQIPNIDNEIKKRSKHNRHHCFRPLTESKQTTYHRVEYTNIETSKKICERRIRQSK